MAAHPGGPSGWVERPPLTQARIGLDVATAGGRIFAIGGFVDIPSPFDSVEARRVGGHGRWRTIAPLATARANPASAELDGIVYAAGGFGKGTAILDQVEKFDPGEGSWSPSQRLPQRRGAAGAATLGGLLYVAGGFIIDDDGTGHVTDSMVAYNPRTGAWRTMAPMPTARYRLRLVAAGRHLYAIGGQAIDDRQLPTVERYEPRSNTWHAVASMNQARALPGAVALRRGSEHFIVVVAGGSLVEGRTIFLRSTEIYSLETGRWRVIQAELPQGRASLVSATEANGTVLAIGGYAGPDLDHAHATAEVHALRITNRNLDGH
jgi:N-acetylneuraminic acid mutarotase